LKSQSAPGHIYTQRTKRCKRGLSRPYEVASRVRYGVKQSRIGASSYAAIYAPDDGVITHTSIQPVPLVRTKELGRTRGGGRRRVRKGRVPLGERSAQMVRSQIARSDNASGDVVERSTTIRITRSTHLNSSLHDVRRTVAWACDNYNRK